MFYADQRLAVPDRANTVGRRVTGEILVLEVVMSAMSFA